MYPKSSKVMFYLLKGDYIPLGLGAPELCRGPYALVELPRTRSDVAGTADARNLAPQDLQVTLPPPNMPQLKLTLPNMIQGISLILGSKDPNNRLLGRNYH